jgi:hypothetical protein
MSKLKRCTIALFAFALGGLVATAEEPRILGIGTEETLPLTGRLPCVAVDTQDQPHIVADGGASAYFFHKIGAAAPWVGSEVNVAALGFRQYFNPHLEIDEANRAWCSGVLVSGIGIFIRENVNSNPTGPFFSNQRIQGAWDIGNLSIDPARPGEMVAMSSNGRWRSFTYNAGSPTRISSLSSGGMSAGGDGEKKSFWISKGEAIAHPGQGTYGIWHLAIGGYPPSQPSAYQNSYRQAQGLSPVAWASAGTYSTMGDDGTYVDCVSDNMDSRIAYMICDFSCGGRYSGTVGVAMNIWNGQAGQMLRGISNLLVIDGQGTSGLRRYAPQLAPARDGGCWACWTSGGRIKVRYIGQDGVLGNTIIDVGAGTWGDICTDSEGDIHVAWHRDGQIRYLKIDVAGGTTLSTFAADFDGDGRDDPATYDDATGTWTIMPRCEGRGTVVSMPFAQPGDIPIVGDFDGNPANGVEVGACMPPRWNIYNGNEFDAYNGAQVHNLAFGTEDDIPIVGDFDGNGRDDIAVFRATTATWYVRGGLSNDYTGATDFNFGNLNAVPLCHNWNTNNPGDEFVVWHPDTKSFHIRGVLFWNGTNTVQMGNVFGEDYPIPADYDGDGVMDFAVFRPEEARWFINGSGGILDTGPTGIQMGSPNFDDVPVPGKYDMDPKADLTIVRDGQEWFIRPSDGVSPDPYGSAPFLFGAPGDTPIPADWDTDGIDDIGVYRNAYWYRWGSTDGGLPTVVFGAPADIPVPADWDGDGIDDMAVWRPSNAAWYRFGSTIGGMPAVSFGAPTDVPIPADYDGDGFADLGVYRDGWWLAWGTSNGPMATTYGNSEWQPIPGNYVTNDNGKAEIEIYNPTTTEWGSGWGAPTFWGPANSIACPADYDGDGVLDRAVFDNGWWWIAESGNGNALMHGSQPIILTGEPFGARYPTSVK